VIDETAEQKGTKRRAEDVKAMRAACAEHERLNNLVPGSSGFYGVPPNGEARGGQGWEDRARMAMARRVSGDPDSELDATDIKAMARFPTPRSGITGAHWPIPMEADT
jgi:hypothetical protein